MILRLRLPNLRRRARVTEILCPRCQTWRTPRQWNPTARTCNACTDRGMRRRARAAIARATYRNEYTNLGRSPGARIRVASAEFGPTPGAQAGAPAPMSGRQLADQYAREFAHARAAAVSGGR